MISIKIERFLWMGSCFFDGSACRPIAYQR